MLCTQSFSTSIRKEGTDSVSALELAVNPKIVIARRNFITEPYLAEICIVSTGREEVGSGPFRLIRYVHLWPLAARHFRDFLLL